MQPLQLVFHFIYKIQDPFRTGGGHVSLYINIRSKDGVFCWIQVLVTNVAVESGCVHTPAVEFSLAGLAIRNSN